MHEVRVRRRQGGMVAKRQDQRPLDDWLGDISDDDWDDPGTQLAEQPATPARQERRAPNNPASPSQGLPVAATDARRTTVGQRRGIAALVALLLVGLGVAAAVLLLPDEAENSASTAQESSAVTETETAPTTSTEPTTTTPTTPTDTAPTFVLPEGTKLQRGESVGESDLTVSTDPELIADLQRALATAGFEPGSPDGSFGENTEAAVIAFQLANGLSPDGIVGPETAAALNSAIASG